ncbi:DUF1294 domain-containing protein [Clostridioides difficile]
MKFIILYIIILNLTLFILMGIDKRRAKLNKWRISEKSLFLFSLFGGSIGGIIGIYTFKHKTRHLKFTFGFPIILILQLIILYIFTL